MSKLGLICIVSIYSFVCGCIKKKTTTFENIFVNEKNVIIKRTYDKSGVLSSEELLNKDSVKDGYYKKYLLGKVKDSGNYKSGQKEGSWYYRDLNGDVIKIENWFSGKQFGEQTEYYSKITAKKKLNLYKYSFFDIDGNKTYECKFDTEGKLLNSSGVPLFCAYNSGHIDVGSSYELICFWGVPEKFKWFFSIEEIEEKTKKKLLGKEFNYDDSSTEILNLAFAKKYFITKKYEIKGDYSWRIYI